MNKYRFLRVLKIITWITIAVVLFSVAVMMLWNWLIPEIFNGPTISLLQAFGLLVLSKILFTGFGGGHNCSHGGKRQIWKQKFYEKMQKMAPEEREKFKSKFGRCFEDWADSKPTAERE